MPPKPKGRPNTPSENANIAPHAGVRVVTAALDYLAHPDGLDAGRDWAHLVKPLETALADLEAIEPSYSMNDKVNPDDIETFRRADKAADDVKALTRADDVQVRINRLLADFRTLWHSAAQGI